VKGVALAARQGLSQAMAVYEGMLDVWLVCSNALPREMKFQRAHVELIIAYYSLI
jgi:hypothetical protein